MIHEEIPLERVYTMLWHSWRAGGSGTNLNGPKFGLSRGGAPSFLVSEFA